MAWCCQSGFLGLRSVISGFWRWTGSAMLMCTCCFLSVSSGPFLALMVQITLAFYAYIARNLEKIWLRLGLVFGIGYLILELSSNRPAIVALTSAVDLQQFDRKRPLHPFRIWHSAGLEDPDPRDRIPAMGPAVLDDGKPGQLLAWAGAGFRHPGISVPVPGVVGPCWDRKRSFKKGGPLANARLGWGITMVSLMLTLATVYIWSEAASLMMFMIEAGCLHADRHRSRCRGRRHR
ncbi:MAG: hypothetical protein R3D46_00940 [Defluviimonas denitrificans]